MSKRLRRSGRIQQQQLKQTNNAKDTDTSDSLLEASIVIGDGAQVKLLLQQKHPDFIEGGFSRDYTALITTTADRETAAG